MTSTRQKRARRKTRADAATLIAMSAEASALQSQTYAKIVRSQRCDWLRLMKILRHDAQPTSRPFVRAMRGIARDMLDHPIERGIFILTVREVEKTLAHLSPRQCQILVRECARIFRDVATLVESSPPARGKPAWLTRAPRKSKRS